VINSNSIIFIPREKIISGQLSVIQNFKDREQSSPKNQFFAELSHTFVRNMAIHPSLVIEDYEEATMKVFVKHFTEIDVSEITDVGGKGANLATLVSAGFPVPSGFCVTTRAYQEFLESAGLGPQIVARLAETNVENLEQLRDCGAAIRQLILEHDIPDIIREAVLFEYWKAFAFETIGENSGEYFVAVRSSATIEDLPESSFAGQYDSYLNIFGEIELLIALKRCWASLWSERAIAYRHRKGIDHTKVLMAAVVQQMIMAEVSGVLCTTNPVNGNRQECVINANWGLGESVVSGMVTPDEFLIEKTSCRIKQQHIAEKTSMTVRDSQGTVNAFVSAEKQQQACLSEEQLQKLVTLGNKLEAHFHVPQDIEWALIGDNVFLLQSRPITALQLTSDISSQYSLFNRHHSILWGHPLNRERLKSSVTYWSNFNVRETMPYPLTPLSWSYWNDVLVPMIMGHVFGISEQSALYPYCHLMDLVNGHIYWNMNMAYGLGGFGKILHLIDDEAGRVFERLYMNGALQTISFPGKLYLPLYKSLFRAALNCLQTLMHLPQSLHPGYIARFWKKACALERKSLHTLAEQELLELFQRTSRMLTDLIWPFGIAMTIGGIASVIVQKLIRKWPDTSIETLIAGISGNKTTESALRVYELSQMPDTLKSLFLTLPVEDLPEALEATEEGREFLERLDQFLEQFGHRSVKEFDIHQPRWQEEPSFLLQMIKNYLQLDAQDQTPLEHVEHIAQERESMTETIRRRLSQGWFAKLFPWKRWLFDMVLRLMQTYWPSRENLKYYWLKLYPGLRRIFTEMGRRLLVCGYLENVEDVYFLQAAELEGLLQQTGQEKGAIRRLVGQRKKAWQEYQTIDTPFIIRSDGASVAEEITEQPAVNVLSGTPAFRGKVTGRARVILDPTQGCSFNKGEILVAPITDPGWTPLFLTASALVMEAGGVISHGAVVAREYGIPAIVGVKDAVKRIHTGDEITVDADLGKVVLL
jgi:pyruvate,water dikinase